MDRNRLFMENIMDNFQCYDNNLYFIDTYEEIEDSINCKVESYNIVKKDQWVFLKNVSIVIASQYQWIEDFIISNNDGKKIKFFEKINDNHYLLGFLTKTPQDIHQYKLAQVNIINNKCYVTIIENKEILNQYKDILFMNK